MDGLTAADIQRLAAPFEAHEHDFKVGLTYIEKDAIMARLNEIDPNWSLEIIRNGTDGDAVMVYGAMTIKGVRRDNVGGDAILRAGKDGAFPDFKVAENTVNAHKSAATDLLQRCAQSFGVGMYLKRLSDAKWVKDDATLKKWLNEQFGIKPSPRPEPIVRAAVQPPAVTPAESKFVQHMDEPAVNPFNGKSKRDLAYEETAMRHNYGARKHFDNLMTLLANTDKVHVEMTVDEIVAAIDAHYAAKLLETA